MVSQIFFLSIVGVFAKSVDPDQTAPGPTLSA